MGWLKIMIHAEVNAIHKYDTLFFRSLYKASFSMARPYVCD